MQPVLKAPGCILLKLKNDGPLSNFAYNLNLRRYNLDGAVVATFSTTSRPDPTG
jgi:hypothetical protein